MHFIALAPPLAARQWFEYDTTVFWIAVVAMVLGPFVIWGLCEAWRVSAELRFKRDLLDRGLSVDEIERLLAARADFRDARK